MTGPRVTVGLLREAGVCSNWFERFAAWYPGGVDVTVERCVSQCNEWPWDDAAEALLTDEGQAAYCPILVDADQSCACDGRTNEQAARAFATAALRHGLRWTAPEDEPIATASREPAS